MRKPLDDMPLRRFWSGLRPALGLVVAIACSGCFTSEIRVGTGAEEFDSWGEDSLAGESSDSGLETEGDPTAGDSAGETDDGEIPELGNPANLCGNGVVDPGEDCDDGGSSAVCDQDCTPPECGDGLVNPEAGESCDPGADAGLCNTNCDGPM